MTMKPGLHTAFSVGAVAMAAATTGGLFYVLPHALKKLSIRRLDERCARERTLVLTYDDGPGPVLTSRLLDVLARHGARATFFPLGMRADEAAETLDRVRREGHEIGVHSHRHHHSWKVAPWAALQDALDGYGSLARWAPRDAMFRPPHGKITLLTSLVMRGRGARLGWWTLDGGDTWGRLPAPQSVVDQVVARGGGVVLLHDFDRDEERGDYVVETTRLLLEAAAREGISVKALSELIAA
jgi:peptidoglycan/xylan/chitin deacetylase (PgdA/CDA1 family)